MLILARPEISNNRVAGSCCGDIPIGNLLRERFLREPARPARPFADTSGRERFAKGDGDVDLLDCKV